MSATPTLHIGILLLPPVQLLDVAAIDILGMITPEYLAACGVPSQVMESGQNFSFHYISETSEPAQLTAGAKHVITDTIYSVGRLDMLFIPGPPPFHKTSEATLKFIAEKAKEVEILASVCTGIFPLAASGVLDGKGATGPRGFLPALKAQFPKVKWEDRRWTSDGKFWSSGEVTNGLDMTAAYARQRFPGAAVEFALEGADIAEREREYPKQAK